MLHARGPEKRALLATRRWITVGLVATAVGSSVLIGLLRWSSLAPVERLLLTGSVALLVIAVWRSANSAWIWAAVGGAFLLVCAGLISPDGSPAWVTVPNVVTACLYVAVVITSRRVGIAMIAVGAALLMALWLRNPSNVLTWAAASGPMRWILLGQVTVAASVLWWTWHQVARAAEARDDVLRELERSTVDAAAREERARAWRSGLVHVHESVLNAVRYVLSAGAIDTAQLRAVLDADSAALRKEAGTEVTTRSLGDAVVRESRPAPVRVVQPLPTLSLSPEEYDVLRASVVEVARNAFEHGHASEITVAMVVEEGDLLVTVADNGEGLAGDHAPGIGTGTVLTESLDSIGGGWSWETAPRGACVSIRTPLRGRIGTLQVGEPLRALDASRLIISAPLVGVCLVGLASVAALASIGEAWAVAAAVITAIIVMAAAGHVIARRPIRFGLGVSMALGLGIGVALLGMAAPACADVTLLSPVVNIAGYAALIMTIWGSIRAGIIALVLWACGAANLVRLTDPGCSEPLRFALANSAFVIPTLLVVTYVGVRLHARADARVRSSVLAEVAQQSRARASEDFAMYVRGAVKDAVAIMQRVADGHSLDAETRRELELADARIRAGIQVDPQVSGSFALLARSLVESASACGVAVEVRALGPVDDRRPVPDGLEAKLRDLLVSRCSGVPTIQAFSDGETDYLAIGLELDSVPVGSREFLGDVVIDVLGSEGQGARTVLVSRAAGTYGDAVDAHSRADEASRA